MNRFEQRLERLRCLIGEYGLDGLLITAPSNVSYFTGTSGTDCRLWVSGSEACLLTDFRYREMAQSCGWLKYSELKSDDAYIDYMSALRETRIGLEEDYLSLAEYIKLKQQLSSKKLIPVSGMVEALRIIKEEDEIEATRRACSIADKCFEHMCGFLKPGISERSAAFELDRFMREAGGEGNAFDTILVSGANSSRPHGVPGDKLIEKGDFVTMDFGCKVGGYCSDMTRTVAVGSASGEMREIYSIVLEAQLEACEKLRAGMTGAEADALCRDIIKIKGYGENFGHGTGHGTGLDIHEAPRLSPSYLGIVPENSLTSIEPGIYLPGRFGVRIEDLAIVKTNGIILLSHSPKELLII